MSEVTNRMMELMKPIDQQIMMCDDRNDTLMLACAMLERCKTILDYSNGKDGRKEIIAGANEK